MASLSLALPAFPGAQGAGADTVGGRGGNVYFVDNLQPNGVGSFQNAVDGVNEPRIVIFRVSGAIPLAHDLTIDKPYLTVAGQTAPGDGICITDYAVLIARTHDVIIRHMRFRPGDVSGTCPVTSPQVWGGDALSIDGAYNIIIDHCSLSWAPDELMHIYDGGAGYDCTNVTLSWSILSESLHDSVHTEGPHGCGLLIKTDGGYVTAHHNLIAHNDTRNPRTGSSPTGSSTYRNYIDFRNNVVYNWGDFSGHGGGSSEYASMNYVGNWVDAGPSTYDNSTTIFRSNCTKSSTSSRYQIYKDDTNYANYLMGRRTRAGRPTRITKRSSQRPFRSRATGYSRSPRPTARRPRRTSWPAPVPAPCRATRLTPAP
jgi:pectate lyase